MKPQTIGRVLGIGVRLTGRAVGKALEGQPSAPGTQPTASAPAPRPAIVTPAQTRAAGQVAGQTSRGLARGVGGFLRPFRQVGGSILLEVAGLFYFLFVVVFGTFVWKNRASYLQGTGHRDFWLSVVAMAIFLYLSISSFWRARKKSTSGQ